MSSSAFSTGFLGGLLCRLSLVAPRRWLCGDTKSDSQLKFSMQDAIELFNREYAILEHMQVRLTRKLMKLTAASEIKNN